MSKLSFVYFDVGGVVVKDFSDTEHWEQMKEMLGLSPSKYDQFEILFKECEIKMCLGEDDVQFLPLFAKKFNLNFPRVFTFTKYIVEHFLPNPQIYPLIDFAQSKYRTGLLTDMYYGMREYMQKRQLFPPNQWDVVIDSSIEKVKKPMPKVYQLAQTRAGVPGEEILFIDNREKNLVVPRQIGWQTFLYDSSNYDQANKDLAAFLQL